MKPDYQVAIIGAGFAGIGAAIRLQMEGHTSFVIFEKAPEIGGTWRDNIYPGCACDIPSHLYSYSFELNPNWSRSFSKQPEILAYLKHCVEKYALGQKIRLNTAITRLFFEEGQACWTLTTQNGETISARVVVLALGPLNVPNIPKISGQASFTGTSFHSSEWKTDYPLKGKRVAIIGTGASAIQIVPEIAKEVDQLFIFQRTAPWVSPRMDKEVSESTQHFFQRFPLFNWLFRSLIYRILEFRGKAFFGNTFIRNWLQKRATQNRLKSITDPLIRQAATPNYEIGCKRILVSDDYYPALNLPQVELIPEEVIAINGDTLTGKNGTKRAVDTIIYATGFHAAEYEKAIEVVGKNQRNLSAVWKNAGPEAYLGTTIAGFPNLLIMIGPNTGLGHNSMIHMMESQFNYLIDYLQLLNTKKLAYLDVKQAVQDTYNQHLQAQLSGMVWATGCKSWYQTEKGKNTTLWPGPTTTYRQQTRHINAEDYELVLDPENRN